MSDRIPVPNISDIPILRRIDICKFQTRYVGTNSIAMSEIMLKIADARYRISGCRQCPGKSGAQILVRGKQRKIGTKKNII